MALLMVTFLMFDRFIQHKISDGNKQRIAALQKQEQSLHKHSKSRKHLIAQIS